MDIIRHHFSIIDSTNTWAKHHADSFNPLAITLITADAQTAGRGRFNRQWVSPPDQNIYATYCIFLEKHRTDIGNLPQVAAISIAQILTETGFSAKLKWPNDVIINNKKVAGILSESTPLSDKLCLIIGIGLNVNMTEEILQSIDRPATSLYAESMQKQDVKNILEKLTLQFSQNIAVFIEEGFSIFLKDYRERMHMPSGCIQFHDNRTVHTGKVHSINNDGSLNLLLSNNTIQTFHAGEIVPDVK